MSLEKISPTRLTESAKPAEGLETVKIPLKELEDSGLEFLPEKKVEVAEIASSMEAEMQPFKSEYVHYPEVDPRLLPLNQQLRKAEEEFRKAQENYNKKYDSKNNGLLYGIFVKYFGGEKKDRELLNTLKSEFDNAQANIDNLLKDSPKNFDLRKLKVDKNPAPIHPKEAQILHTIDVDLPDHSSEIPEDFEEKTPDELRQIITIIEKRLAKIKTENAINN